MKGTAMNIILTLAAAAAGGIAFLLLKIPGSLMVGAMLATLFFNICTGAGYLPSGTSTLVQFLLGTYIGTMLHREDLKKLKVLRAPALILLLGMTGYAILTGYLFHLAAGCDILTAMYVTAPGGMVEVCLFAGETGGNTSLIAAFHTLRTAILYLAIPVLATAILKKKERSEASPVEPAPAQAGPGGEAPMLRTLLTLAVGAAGAAAGKFSGVPAGTLLFAIAFTGIFAISGRRAYVPRWLKRTAQILSGAVIGMRCDIRDFLYIKEVWPCALLIILGYLLMTVALGKLLSGRGYMDLPTGIFSCCAGGVSDVTLVASDYNVDLTKIVLLHLVRYLSIFVTYPILGAIFA